ncbi:C2H2-type domain-containing protein [Fusarium sp. LHS14.1]|nr:C2H2-type domain-containing protein [Fusarium sp. LHS14.1]
MDFWYGLSGHGMITKDPESVSNWNLECLRKKARIHGEYLRHLMTEKDTKDVPSRGIISVVETFVEMGYLQSIEEAKNYMKKIGQSLFGSKIQAYAEFLLWVTGPIMPFVCRTCKREFDRKWNMERHYDTVHNKKGQKGQKEGSRKRRKMDETCAPTPVSMIIKDE